MSNWILQRGSQPFNGVVTTGSNGISIPVGASGTYGAWTEITNGAPLPYDVNGFYFAQGAGGTPYRMRFEFAVGVAGADDVVLDNYQLFIGNGAYSMDLIPLFLPAGRRVFVRASWNHTSAGSVDAFMIAQGNSARAPRYPQKYVSFNLDESTNLPSTIVLAGTTINTKGAYGTIVPSAPFDASVMLLRFVANVSNSGNATTYLVDLATGGVGTEQILMSNIPMRGTGVAGGGGFPPRHFFVSIPRGTRIAARGQSSSTLATNREIGVIIHLG